MDDSLPSEFDLIVVGTGFTESVVAAAASRIGKTVLHLDANEFYGGPWASFNLESMLALAAASQTHTEDDNSGTVVSIEPCRNLSAGAFRLHNVRERWAPERPQQPDEVVESASETTTSSAVVDTADTVEVKDSAEPPPKPPTPTAKQLALKQSRRFNIDLTPRLLFARGALVELLISSNICRYSEFRAVDRVATADPATGSLRSVPCCRADIFTSREVTVVEKHLLSRTLLQLLQLQADDDALHAAWAPPHTFGDYLRAQRLSAKLVHYVVGAIAMCGERVAFAEGAARTKRFLESAERYGSTPFLFTMYGCGEIPQCFCRLCAVFGGVYCLKRPIEAIHRDAASGRFEAITCGGQRITAAHIVFGADTVEGADGSDKKPSRIGGQACGRMSRAVLLSRRPFGDAELNSGGGGVVLLRLPSAAVGAVDENDTGATVLQLSHFSGTSPKDWYLIHLIANAAGDDPEADLAPYVAQLFGDDVDADEAIVWRLFFSQPACTQCNRSATEPLTEGVHYVCGPHFELDYDRSIEQARELFGRLYDGAEFLPRAPDPDEIIVAGSEEDDEREATAESVTVDDIRESKEEVDAKPVADEITQGAADNA